MSHPDLAVLSGQASPAPVLNASGQDNASPRPLVQSSSGRVSGKGWKPAKSATVMFPRSLMLESTPVQIRRSHLPEGVKTKKWDDRMQKVKKEQAIKKLQAELKDEKLAQIQRRKEITLERKKAAEERHRLEEEKAKMGARKAARLRRKAGRTKKINH
ncbi:hypothetical protein V8D89_016219 [Ganoderma adspersum]